MCGSQGGREQVWQPLATGRETLSYIVYRYRIFAHYSHDKLEQVVYFCHLLNYSIITVAFTLC